MATDQSHLQIGNLARRRATRCLVRKGVDESLRAEVEKLLESHQKASDEKFIDGVAAEADARC